VTIALCDTRAVSTTANQVPDRPLWQWSAREVVAASTAGLVSCAEVTRAVVERIRSANPDVNAVTLELGEESIAAAETLDAQYARGAVPGALHGVPVTIKDNIDVRGQRTPNGLPGLAELIAPDDSPVTRNLRTAGAVLVGRTNTPEVSMRPTTNNPLYGLTVSPWNSRVSCGGSSGGAGVAVLSGFGALGHGNDIGGSIRIPALHCGVPGLKPTQGRIPAYVPSAEIERSTVAALMSVQGLLARTVGDLRLGLAAMSVGDPRDPWWVPARLEGPPVPRRAAVLRSVEALPTHSSVLTALDRAAAELQRAGYQVVEVDERETPGVAVAARLGYRLLMNDLDHQLRPVLARLGSDEMQAYWRAARDESEPYPSIPAYVDDLAARTGLLREWVLFLDEHPVLLMPLLLGPLLEVDEDVRSLADAQHIWLSMFPSIAVNLLGLPSVLTPTGEVDGLPSGVQVVAPRYREDVCLAAAEVIEAGVTALPPMLWDRKA
jgi:amidase